MKNPQLLKGCCSYFVSNFSICQGSGRLFCRSLLRQSASWRMASRSRMFQPSIQGLVIVKIKLKATAFIGSKLRSSLEEQYTTSTWSECCKPVWLFFWHFFPHQRDPSLKRFVLWTLEKQLSVMCIREGLFMAVNFVMKLKLVCYMTSVVILFTGGNLAENNFTKGWSMLCPCWKKLGNSFAP